MNISDYLTKYLVGGKKRTRKSSGKYYLSTMGQCRRMRFLKRKGIKTEFDPFVTWSMELGNLCHDWGYKALEAQSRLVDTEDYVSNEHFIGRYDGIVSLTPKGKDRIPFDFKTVRGYKMQKIMDIGDDAESDILQLLSYVIFLKKERKITTDYGLISYINREPSNQNKTVFFERKFYLTATRKREILEEFDVLGEAWELNKLPKCNCHTLKDTWRRKYNNYAPLCKMSEAEVKRVLSYQKVGQVITTKTKLFFINEEGKRKELLCPIQRLKK